MCCRAASLLPLLAIQFAPKFNSPSLLSYYSKMCCKGPHLRPRTNKKREQDFDFWRKDTVATCISFLGHQSVQIVWHPDLQEDSNPSCAKRPLCLRNHYGHPPSGVFSSVEFKESSTNFIAFEPNSKMISIPVTADEETFHSVAEVYGSSFKKITIYTSRLPTDFLSDNGKYSTDELCELVFTWSSTVFIPDEFNKVFSFFEKVGPKMWSMNS